MKSRFFYGVLIFWFVLYQDKMNNRKLKTGCDAASLSRFSGCSMTVRIELLDFSLKTRLTNEEDQSAIRSKTACPDFNRELLNRQRERKTIGWLVSLSNRDHLVNEE